MDSRGLGALSSLRYQPRAGMALVAVLGAITLLFVLAAAVMRRQSQSYRSVSLIADRSVAQALAESGLEDARLKIEKDYTFPPRSPQQLRFDYSEQVHDFNGTLVGSYAVSIDSSRSDFPHRILVVQATGWVERDSKVTAQQSLIADFSLNADTPQSGKIVRMRSREFGRIHLSGLDTAP